MPALLGGIDDKISVFRERYNALWQRTIRHELFTPAHRKAQSAQFSLQKIEYLKGVSIKMKDCVILGMLTQMKEGEWWLEDPTGKRGHQKEFISMSKRENYFINGFVILYLAVFETS